MTISVAAADLKRAVAFAQQVTHKKATIPILRTVLMEFCNDKLTVTGTNLDTWCSMSVDARAKGKTRFCIGPLAMARMGMMAEGGDVSFTVGTACAVEADGIKATFNMLFPAEDFPAPNKDMFKTPTGTAVMSEGDLFAALKDTVPFISTEATRYYLNGVYLHAKAAGTLIAVATDGHRLARKTTDIPWVGLDHIFPKDAASMLLRLVRKGANAEVHITGSPNAMLIEGGNGAWSITAKTIDGTFPDYLRVIPDPSENQSVPLTWEQLRRLSAFATGRHSSAVLFCPEKGVMRHTDVGDGIDVSVPLPDAKGAEFCINVHYIAALARRYGTIRLTSAKASDPVNVITEDASLTLIVMPMRV